MKKVNIDGKQYVSGNDYYSYASEPNIYIKQNKNNYGIFGGAATISVKNEIIDNVEISTKSEIDIENEEQINISSKSEIDFDGGNVENIDPENLEESHSVEKNDNDSKNNLDIDADNEYIEDDELLNDDDDDLDYDIDDDYDISTISQIEITAFNNSYGDNLGVKKNIQ